MASVVRPMRRERFPVSRGRAGVEEVMGFAGSLGGLAGSGMGMLLGSRTATRDLVARGFPGVPLGRSAGRCAVSGSFLGCVVV